MQLIFLFRRFVFAQVLLGIVAFCVAEPNPGMLLVAGAIGALAWYVTEGPSGRPLPRWTINLASLVAVGWLLMDLQWQNWQVVIAMGHFTMWLQIILLYAHKSNREYAQLLVLSLMQMVGASLLSVSMLYGVMLAVYCVVALITILLFHLKSTSDRVWEANRAAAPRRAKVMRPKPVVGRGHRWHFRFMSVAVGVICVTTAVAVFVVMPRTDDGRMAGALISDQAASSEAGFSQQVDLNSAPLGEGSKQPILNMTVSLAGESPPHDPEGRSFLLRGAALDRYDTYSHRWLRSEAMHPRDTYVSVPPGGVRLADLPDGVAENQATITLRQVDLYTLFTIGPVTYLQSENIGRIGFNPIDQQVQAHRSGAGAVIYSLRWTSEGVADLESRYKQALPEPVDPTGMYPRQGSASQRMTDEELDAQYARPWTVQRERIAKLVTDTLQERGLDLDAEPLQIAEALADHLMTDYRYALENPQSAGRRDPVVEFLFDHRRGHCELFASGLAAMLRSVDIPARVITGYHVSEYNRIGGYYVVRRSHAHAWVEAPVGPGGAWVTLDATPPDEVASEHAVTRNWLTSLRELYEHIEFAWIKSVVAYDQRTRNVVLTQINQSIGEVTDERESLFGRIVAWFRDLPRLWRSDQISYTLAGIILIAIGIGVASLVRTLVVRRRRLIALQLTAMPRTKRRGLTRKLRFYLTMLDMLERHGYIRPQWQSPFSFAQELAEANPMRFDPVVTLTELFYEIRFGHREMDDQRRRKIRAHLKQLEHALAQRPA